MSHVNLETLAAICAFILISAVQTCIGNPLFENSNWLDKLPSFEVKVRTDGFSVQTGPSRDEIYTIISYVIAGLVLVVILAVTITICAYKCCCCSLSRGLSPNTEWQDQLGNRKRHAVVLPMKSIDNCGETSLMSGQPIGRTNFDTAYHLQNWKSSAKPFRSTS